MFLLVLKVELFILIVVLTFRVFYCDCIHTYKTVCDSFEDVKNTQDMDNWNELVIGSEKSADLSSINLAEIFNMELFNKLTSLVILRRINRLEITPEFYDSQCGGPLNNNLEFISLYGNDLKIIEKNQFSIFPIKKLSLVNNQIEIIEKGAFANHQSEIFDISDNLIQTIVKEMLPSTNATKTISIRRNQLVNIEPGSFPYSLRNLHLDGNNLRYLHNGIFENLTNLEKLTLSRNKLDSIPLINSLQNLKFVDFSFNSIMVIGNQPFGQLLKLQVIDLSHNKIDNPNILGKLSVGQQQIASISLAFNHLRNLTQMTVNKNWTLIMYGNPWDCSKWQSMASQLISRESVCGLQYYSSGKTPFCLKYTSGTATSKIKDDIDLFHGAIRRNAKLVGCNLAPEMYEKRCGQPKVNTSTSLVNTNNITNPFFVRIGSFDPNQFQTQNQQSFACMLAPTLFANQCKQSTTSTPPPNNFNGGFNFFNDWLVQNRQRIATVTQGPAWKFG